MSHHIEAAYRRGVAQAFTLAAQIAGQSQTAKAARRRLELAEDIAHQIRADHEWAGPVIDSINSRVHARFSRRQPSTLLEEPEPFHAHV
jgi:hypothetical protein